MTSRLRQARLRRTQDEGFTLVEMLVAMLIFGVAMALVMAALLTLTRQTRSTLGRAESIENARVGLSQIDRQVRSGNLFYDPTPSNGMRMLVFTQSNGDRKCAEWRVETDGSLRTRSWSPTWTTDGDVGSWAIFARGVVNNAPGYPATPAFTVTTVGTGGQPVLNVRLLLRDKNDSRGDKKSNRESVEVATTLSGRNTLFGYDPVACQNVPAA